jgi:hypothetical protein
MIETQLEARQQDNRDGEPYLAALVNSKIVSRFLPTLEKHIGERRTRRYVLNLRRRNGGTFHVTLLSPYETGLRQSHVSTSTAVVGTGRLHGIGAVKHADNETYFVVVTCPVFQAFRMRLALPPRDLHITLGFKKRDIHNVPKGLATLLPTQEASSKP